jgi:hypothetical protein
LFLLLFFLYSPPSSDSTSPGWPLSCWDNNVWWPVRYLLRHPLPERRGQYIPLPPSSRQQQQQQPQQICRAAGNWPGASAATRDADRKSVRPFISFSR